MSTAIVKDSFSLSRGIFKLCHITPGMYIHQPPFISRINSCCSYQLGVKLSMHMDHSCENWFWKPNLTPVYSLPSFDLARLFFILPFTHYLPSSSPSPDLWETCPWMKQWPSAVTSTDLHFQKGETDSEISVPERVISSSSTPSPVFCIPCTSQGGFWYVGTVPLIEQFHCCHMEEWFAILE